MNGQELPQQRGWDAGPGPCLAASPLLMAEVRPPACLRHSQESRPGLGFLPHTAPGSATRQNALLCYLETAPSNWVRFFLFFFFFKEIIYTGSLIFLSTSKNEAPIRQRPKGVCQIWSTEGGPLATARLECFKSGTLITTSGPKSLSSHRNASKACACFWKLYSHFTYSQNLTRAHCRIMQEICKFHQGVILCFFTHYCIMPRQNTNVCTVLK